MKPAELLSLLEEFYRDRLRLLNDHQASAQRVGQYHFNNTYQYIIAREETHLRWVADAITRLGGVVPPDVAAPSTAAASERQAIATDRGAQYGFLDRWRPRVEQVTNARDRKMLEIILDESLEHARFFVEALAGDTELLGPSAPGAGERGTVMSTRWIE